MSLGILIFIVAILVVVMVHESGHFLVAKIFGFKAPQFFVGFGPTLWSFRKGETEYGVKAIPAGGFVKIIGMNPYEEVAPQDLPRAYPNKPRWQRALLLVAGSATHWLVAFMILFFTAMTIGFPTDRPSNELALVQQSAPAGRAGLESGDRIVMIEDVETNSWSDVRTYIEAHPSQGATLTVERDGDTLKIDATLGRAIFDENGVVAFERPGEELRSPRAGEEVRGFLGVVPDVVYEDYGVTSAIGKSTSLTWTFTWGALTGIDDIFEPVFNGELWEALQGQGEREAEEGPIGVVGAGRIAGQSVESGRYLELIQLIVFFTIFVGILNLLPLPPLDGGHLAVVAFEAVTGKTVDIRKLIPIAAAVISFFVLLFLAVLYLDIARPVKVPF